MDNIFNIWTLIQNMTPLEIREVEFSFKQRGPRALQSDPAKLFRALQSVSAYNTETIGYAWRRQFKEKSKPMESKAFTDARYILKGIILDVLVKSNFKYLGGEAERLLYHSEILSSKGMYEESYKALKQALIETNHCVSPFYKSMILQKLLNITPKVSGKNLEENVYYLLHQIEQDAQDLNQFFLINKLNTHTALTLFKTAILNDGSDLDLINEIAAHPLIINETPNLSYSSSLYLEKTKSWIFGLTCQYEKQYIAQKKLYQLLATNEQENLDTKYVQIYLTEVLDLALFSAKFGNDTECNFLTDYVLSKAPAVGESSSLFNLYPQFIKVLSPFYKKEIPKLQTMVNEYEPILYEQFEKLPIQARDNVRLGMMRIFILLNSHTKIKQWHYLLNEPKVYTRLDANLVCHIVYTCSLYELSTISVNKQNITTIPGLRKQVLELKKLCQNRPNTSPVEAAIINTFIKIMDTNLIQFHLVELNNLMKFLGTEKNKNALYLKRFLNMFDLSEWIRNQLMKMNT
ncbi:MAG: hypothetical protein V9F05_04895 [Chitinophagaceae bacterium]